MKNGDIRLGSICGELIEIGGERYIFGTMRDITDERQAANQLAAERERLAVTLRGIGDAVITTDREGRIVLMNPIAEDLTGWPEAEAAAPPLLDVFRIVNERTREPCVDPVEKVLATGQIVRLANHTMLIARDGREFVIADSGAPILDLEGAIIGVVLVFRDITGQERIEKELLKMEKMQSLGVLAGGIAYDFNNFLSGIIGNLSLAKLDIQPIHPVLRPLDEMENAALRAKELTQQLLTFSKGGEPVRRTPIVTDLISEAAQFALRGSNVRCDIKNRCRFATGRHRRGADRPGDAQSHPQCRSGHAGWRHRYHRGDVRAIVASGYSNDPVMANHAHYGFRGAVKKPYLVQEMSRVLNEVIKGWMVRTSTIPIHVRHWGAGQKGPFYPIVASTL